MVVLKDRTCGGGNDYAGPDFTKNQFDAMFCDCGGISSHRRA